MSNRISNSIKNTASNFGIKLILLILQFATKTIFIRYLDAYIGFNALIVSLLSYLNIAELGIGSAINFAMYKPISENNEEKVRQYLAYYRKIYHILGFVVIGIGLVLAPFLPLMMNFDDIPVGISGVYTIYALYLINSSVTYFVYAYRGGFLNASQKEYKLAPINYTANILSVVLQAIVLVALNGSFLSFCLYTAIPLVISVARSLFNGIFIAKWYPYIKEPPIGKLCREEKKDLYKNTYGIGISKICTIVNNSIDNIIISSFIGVNILGNYSLYYSLISLVAGFVEIPAAAIRPSVGNLNVEKNLENKKRIFNLVNLFSLWIYGFCAISYFVIVQPFMTIWAGEEKIMNIIIPLIIAVNFLTGGMTSAVNIFRESCGLFFQGRYRPVFTTIVNVLLSVILGGILTKFFGYTWGIFGIVLASVISRMAVIWWFDAYLVFKHVFNEKVYKYLAEYLLNFLFVILVGAATWFVCSWIDFNPFLTILLRAIICIIIVNGIFYVAFGKQKAFKQLKDIIMQSFRRAKNKRKR